MATSYQSRKSFLGRMAWNIVVGLVLLPFALAGLVINFVPFVLLWLVGRLKVDPAVAATVKPGAAILLFSITWGVAGWSLWTLSGFEGVAAVLLVMPLYLFALFALVERGQLIWRAWRGWWSANRRDLYDGILDNRRAVVEAVVDAI